LLASTHSEPIKNYIRGSALALAMAKEKFVLVSLQEEKAKKLAQVITNESCRRILDYLAEKDATESELAEKLMLPISTVHYNLKQLTEGGLVVSEEFHYSEKGKEVNHYRLANKYIIIAPKTVWGIKEKLKSILPVVLVVGAAAGFLQLFAARLIKQPVLSVFTTTKQTILRETVVQTQEKALTAPAPMLGAARDMAAEAATLANETVQHAVNATAEHLLPPDVSVSSMTTPGSALASVAVWFVIGAATALVAYLVIDYIRRK
jgi:DNA-binding transcriptional ArsR family regulator